MFICVFCFFQLGMFVDVKTFKFLDTFTLEWKLLSVLISRMSILVENWWYDSESWSDTLKKQFINCINNTWTKTDLSNRYSVALLHKIYFLPCFDSAAILGKRNFFQYWFSVIIRLLHNYRINAENQSVDCSFSHSELKPNRERCKLPNSVKHPSSRYCTGKLGSLRSAKW